MEAPTKRDWLDYAQYAFTWLMGRGAVSAAVVASSWAGADAGLRPYIAVPLGLVISFFGKHLWHRHEERQLLDHYREQIGATLGIDPKQVSLEHLHTVAAGDQANGLPPNRTMQEYLARNDRDWWIKVAADVLGVAAVLGSFFGLNLGQGIQPNQYMGVAMALGIANLGVSYGIRFAADAVLGQNRWLVCDRIDEIREHLHKGEDVTPEHVLELFIQRNPELGRSIREMYGKSFGALSPAARREVVMRMDDAYPATAYARAINEERMDPSELAFAVEGRASGVPIKPPGTYHEDSLGQQLKHLIHRHSLIKTTGLGVGQEGANHPLPEVEYSVTTSPDGKWVRTTRHEHHEHHGANGHSFVEKYASTATGKDESFVRRLAKESSVGDIADTAMRGLF